MAVLVNLRGVSTIIPNVLPRLFLETKCSWCTSLPGGKVLHFGYGLIPDSFMLVSVSVQWWLQ